MGRLTKKTTILFDAEEYERLKRAARLRRCSVGNLIRSALREKNLLSDSDSRSDAAERLSQLSLPVSDWEEMEREILAGASE